MPLTMSFDIAQVLDITGEVEHLTDLVNAIIRQREDVLEEEVDDIIFEVLGDLCAHLKDPARGGLRGRDMKTVVHTWIEDRLVAAGG